MISRELHDFLNISGEPYSYFNEQQVHTLLTKAPADYYQYMKTLLFRISTGKAQLELPDKLVFSDGPDEGDFRVMPCVIRDEDDVWKTVKIIGTNRMQHKVPGQITVGKAFALDAQENFITHVFEACLLSSARTAICAVMAIDLLLPAFPRKLAIAGAGRVGYYTALFAAAVGNVQSITITDCVPERAHACVERLRESVRNAHFSVSTSLQNEDAEAVVLCTTSLVPFYSAEHAAAQIVVSVGADTSDQHELDVSWADGAKLFVDTKDSLHFGDLAAWLASGLITADSVSDLFSVARGEHRTVSYPVAFISTGSALFDNMTIAYLLSGDPV